MDQASQRQREQFTSSRKEFETLFLCYRCITPAGGVFDKLMNMLSQPPSRGMKNKINGLSSAPMDAATHLLFYFICAALCVR